MNNQTLIKLSNVVPRLKNYEFKEPINWEIKEGEQWCVIGANGAGKTQLISVLLEKQSLVSGKIEGIDSERIDSIAKYVAFSSIYSFFDAGKSYYQQRWNIGDTQTAPVVKELFKGAETESVNFLIEAFNIDKLLEKRINMLSSGELRKTLIVLSLLSKPRILILDNPYIGLDADSRKILDHAFKQLITINNTQIITVVSSINDIPAITTHVLPVKNKTLLQASPYKQFINNKQLINTLFENNLPEYKKENPATKEYDFENILIFKNINIKYGDKVILKDINWHVKRGEKWLLLGKNGSGKSTLLSLVFCDNPQAYANNIVLFDKKRGAGQSIWDIKKRIGFISAEIATYYNKNISCTDVVASGFFDTIGSPYKYNEGQKTIALEWMNIFGIRYLENTSFLSVSTGEKQLVLLARAFVKDPDLLILDEPFHGLDNNHKNNVANIIEEYGKDKSLIFVTHYESEIPSVITNRLVL